MQYISMAGNADADAEADAECECEWCMFSRAGTALSLVVFCCGRRLIDCFVDTNDYCLLTELGGVDVFS